ncbi:OLC1v1021125C2 [Oldenlandia corymbosa var. corymbosa]|uniref:OLC1v1021125C2 n=1 Tax=Oldenlandia corymbosa var. corymbosa TaxID=529605 RepID=A0AAV1BV00_OLDCO|nr:OLC1v1021125C2 [Oldenlandia corymbosa var. corymbosa]
MSNNNATTAEDPLLPPPKRSVESLYHIVMKRRRPSSTSSNALIHQKFHSNKDHQHDDELEFLAAAQKKLNVKTVLIFLTAYISTGVVSLCIVRDQISGNKTNQVLDAIYFCVVTMTTVGYGDLVPQSKLAKLLACILVFAGMALVGFVLSNAADYILEKQEILLVKATHLRKKYQQDEILKDVEAYKTEYKFIAALGLLVFLIIIGVVFLHKVEDLSVFDALYCVCATITTLGYGDKSFSTKMGRLFASFWILISTLCLAQVFYYLAELYTERRRKSFIRWVLSKKMTVTDLEAADLDHDSAVSAAEFILYKLKEMGKISDEDIGMVMEQFRNLDIDQSGTLTKSDIVQTSSSDSPR